MSLPNAKAAGKINPRTGRTPQQQVIYAEIYILAREYIKSDIISKRDFNGATVAELATDLHKLVNDANWKCSYTGVQLNCNRRDIWKVSFDRIDNSLGHTIDNMVVTAGWLNKVRSNMDYTTWITAKPWETVVDQIIKARG
jgi:hypothetical protein